MIQVKCDTVSAFMEMTGHAGAAPKGQDTVCAAASMLMYTLAAMVRDYGRSGLAKDVVIELEPGRAFVSCRAARGVETTVYQAFAMAFTGMQLLEECYPEYVECVPPWGEEEVDEEEAAAVEAWARSWQKDGKGESYVNE